MPETPQQPEKLPQAAHERILVVDDDAQARDGNAAILEKNGYAVEKARSGDTAVEILQGAAFDLILTDIVMPGMSGFDVISFASKKYPDTVSIAMTSFGSLDAAMDALRLGAYSFLTKPCDPSELKHVVARGLEKQRLTKELRQRNAALQELNRDLDHRIQEATKELVTLNKRMLTEMASLQEVDRLKSEFLDTVTHDLRNPLTAIYAYLEVALEGSMGELSEDMKTSLRSAKHAASHMEYLVNELIMAAQLRSGKIHLDLKDARVQELLDEAAAVIVPNAAAKQNKVEARWEGDPAYLIKTDRGRLLQILNNLLGNANKFTPNGGRIVLWARPEESGVHFCVEDTGPGIAPEHHKKIFDRFYQVNSSTTREHQGLGLGLGIARDLVDLHKGKIWVESEPGKGSKFHIVIPAGK